MYDIIVVGAGHAGVEAALACARLNKKTALVTLDINAIAKMPCNPSIGGPAKGIVVREIDALGGQMGITADETALQFKMLNLSKGPGVQSLRVQSDKIKYSNMMRDICLQQENLTVIEEQVIGLLVENKKAIGIKTKGQEMKGSIVILTTGTYLSSLIMISDNVEKAGPDNEQTTNLLSESLESHGIELFRLKTGTPPRVKTNSIDFSKTSYEPGSEEFYCFSHKTKNIREYEKQLPCYLTYTNSKTHQVILDNLNKSSMYSGVVKGVGPRYCPSIEDKLVRFKDKERHQLFLEPESELLDTTYIQGFSSSLPIDVQDKMIRTIEGLENVVVDKYAYAIEYDAINPLQLRPNLENKIIENLFCAGQINGTSGYEEAAAQGLLAGINAVNKLNSKQPLILRKDESYIGVMIDDLCTKGTLEPYRLLTSRAEFRLLLRHDNAMMRLSNYAIDLGLLPSAIKDYLDKLNEDIIYYKEKLNDIRFTPKSEVNTLLKQMDMDTLNDGISALDLIKRPHLTLQLLEPYTELKIDKEVSKQIEIDVKYEGYIKKAHKEATKLKQMEMIKLPEDINYDEIINLSLEARQKLNQYRPLTMGQATRISGINPADIQVISIYLEKRKREKNGNKRCY